MNSPIKSFNKLLSDSRRAVVFTGAGISTESGIPDFRGPGGLWTKMKPIDYQDFLRSDEVRQTSWKSWFELSGGMLTARPNAGHRAVSDLVSRGLVSAVITQNVDNLHQQAGVAPGRVIELHGNATYAKCLSCSKTRTLESVEAEFRQLGRVNPCGACGGIIKTAAVSFGQAMPAEAMQRAEEETLACDLFIVLGSSLSVYPAAGFPAMAHRNGARLVIVNHQPTDLDPIADLVIRDSIGETMTELLNQAGLA